MFKPSPFKDAEVNPEPPQRDFRDWMGMTFSFIWFFRRLIIGVILLGGLGFWIRHATTNPRLSGDTEQEQSPLGPQRSIAPKIPKANIDFANSPKQPNAPDDNPDSINAANRGANIVEKDSNPPRGIDPADGRDTESSLEEKTTDELIEESLKLRKSWGSASPSVGLLMCARRAKIARQLMERELSDTELAYAISTYIESISLVDSLNVASKMKMDEPRAALLEIDETYSNHPDTSIAGKANLAMLLAPIYEFVATDDLEKLVQIRQSFDQRVDKIIQDPASVARLAEMCIAINNKPATDSATRDLVFHILNRLEQDMSPSILKTATVLRERIIFDPFDLSSLQDRIENGDKSTREDVQGFFQALADNPNSNPKFFQNAINCIVKFKLIGEDSDAEALSNWLGQITLEIKDDDVRKRVLDVVEKLKKK